MKMEKGEAGQDVDQILFKVYRYYDNIGNDGNGNVNDDDDERP